MADNLKRKSAIIPYRQAENQLELLLIRNVSDTKWVIPKGTIDFPLAPHISATKEAYEEAGVLGRPHPILVGTYFKNDQLVPTYLLEVDVELVHYEEVDIRNRRWVFPEQIRQYVEDEDLQKLLLRGIKCIRKPGTYFKYAMKTFCESHTLTVHRLSKKAVHLDLSLDADRERSIRILRFGTTLEFCVPTSIRFSAIHDIQQEVFTRFLLENADHTLGFWCLQETLDGFRFARNHTIELRLLNETHFKKIIQLLTERCVEFEEYHLLMEGLRSLKE
ncbi:MAG: NUDIX domain-containing protein [Bacteroidota bacterium]